MSRAHAGAGDPTVVISDTPPPTVVCRNRAEENAAQEILNIMRRGHEPMAVIFRTREGAIEVHARSSMFCSVGQAIDVMKEATIKLTQTLFRVKGTLL